MSAEDQKLLFQPFMQIRPGELQKGRGSGLGLSICKTIVTLHGGVIGCHSKQRVGKDKESGGSDFFFTIGFERCLDVDCELFKQREDDGDMMDIGENLEFGEFNNKHMKAETSIDRERTREREREKAGFDNKTNKPLLKSLSLQADEAYTTVRRRQTSSNSSTPKSTRSSSSKKESISVPHLPLSSPAVELHNNHRITRSMANNGVALSPYSEASIEHDDEDRRSVSSTLSRRSSKSVRSAKNIISDENYIAVVPALPISTATALNASTVEPEGPITSKQTSRSEMNHEIGHVLVCDGKHAVNCLSRWIEKYSLFFSLRYHCI
jgi:hypothetical protein